MTAVTSAVDQTAARKDAHLDLCIGQQVEPPGNAALFDCIALEHCAMPELALEQIDASSTLLGRRLSYPLCITGMTGGTERARQVNQALARCAQEFQIAFGVGSQRAMAEDPARSASYQVRKVAPDVVLIGNIGMVQALAMGVDGVHRLIDAIGADGIALHLNPAQELIQPEGDRDFRGGYRLVEALASTLGRRLMVKETGCGLSAAVARRLAECGVSQFDVSGLGGTSWVRVEQLRAGELLREVGATFSGWGIPTAAATWRLRRALGAGPAIVASGGMRSGLDVAKAVVLGADAGGMALPLLRAFDAGGEAQLHRLTGRIVREIEYAMLLTGSRDLAALRQQQAVIRDPLRHWMAAPAAEGGR